MSPFSPDYAMICQHGGLVFVHHNIHDITAEWLNKIWCHWTTTATPFWRNNCSKDSKWTGWNLYQYPCPRILGATLGRFLMLGFSIPIHPANTQLKCPVYLLVSQARKEEEVGWSGSKGWTRPPLSLLFLQLLWVRRHLFFIMDLPTYCPTRTMQLM